MYQNPESMSEEEFSDREESEEHILEDDENENEGNLFDYDALRESVDYACEVHVPGVDPLRRHSPTFERQLEGGVSPLPRLGRRSRTGHSTPSSLSFMTGELFPSSLEARPPSAPGYTSMEINVGAPRNTPIVNSAEQTFPQNNSMESLTDHYPVGAVAASSNYSRLFGDIHISDSADSFDEEGDEIIYSRIYRPRPFTDQQTPMLRSWDLSQRKSQLDSTVPRSVPIFIDRPSRLSSENERLLEISNNDARCFRGVEIVESPPTGLVNITDGRQYEDDRSHNSQGKPNVKGSIFLAGLFTGIAVIVGRIFTRKKEK
eukprot:g8149.t1